MSTDKFKELVEKAKSFINRRQQAYKLTFRENEMTKIVLRDLADFCRAQKSTFHEDERMHAVLEGRREVWLRIEHHLKLDTQQLWNQYGRSKE